MFLGGKTTAWVGAIIVVLGSAFAIREFGAGLWSDLPNAIKALVVAGFGGMLLALGEVAFRRVGRAASVGLFGAGLGTLYLDAYATCQWFAPPVTSQEVSFLLMAIVAAGAFAITVRTRSLTIGVLSMLGGYLTPILLSGGGEPLPVMVYLTILAGVGLALAARLPETFSPLRYLALSGQMLLGLAVIIGSGSSHWMMMLVFTAIWWTMFMSEAVLTAMRDRSPLGNIVSSLIATSAFVTVGGWVLVELAPPMGAQWLGAFTLMIAALSAVAALQFGPGLETLRGTLRTAMDKLAVGLWVQCAVLLPLAIALQFDGYGASIGWLALAVGCIEIGRRLPSRGVSIFGLVIGTLALFRIVTIDQFVGSLQVEVWSWRGVSVDRWSLLALAALASLHLAAQRVGDLLPTVASEKTPSAPTPPAVLALFGTLGWMLLCVRQMDGLFITGGWLLGAATLLAVERSGKRQRYLELAVLVLAFTAARWFLADAMAPRLEPTWSATASLPLLNWQMATAVAIALGGWWSLLRMRRRQAEIDRAPSHDVVHSSRSTWLVQISMLVGMLFMLVALSFEIDRTVTRIAAASESVLWSIGHVRQLMFTLLWAAGSAGLGLLAMLVVRRAQGHRDAPRAKHDHLLLCCAWGLLLACALKWIVVDTLLWVLPPTHSTMSGMMPMANVQLLVGFVIAAIAVVLLAVNSAIRGTDRDGDATPMPWHLLSAWTPVAVSFMILWGLTFEVDRLLSAMQINTWPAVQLRMLWWTGLWAAGGMAMMLFGQWRQRTPMLAAGWGVIAVAGLAWLFLDTLPERILNGLAAVDVVFNLQFMIGLLVAALLSVGAWMILRLKPALVQPSLATVGLASIAAIGLWLGSLEIDRFFAANAMGKQMGLSVYWMLYGVLLVLTGFAKRVDACRYAGLALLSMTVVKVLIVDLANVDQIWRVASLIVSGLLLIVTSVAYRKFASRLLIRQPTEQRAV